MKLGEMMMNISKFTNGNSVDTNRSRTEPVKAPETNAEGKARESAPLTDQSSLARAVKAFSR